MHRRDLLQLLGSAAFAPALSRMSPEQRLDLAEFIHRTAKSAPKVLTPQQDALVVAVAEMIIPRTETPGATDAKVNEFVDTLLAGWYDDDDKRQFLHGLDAMDAEAMALGGSTFANAAPLRQKSLLDRWSTSESGPETATAQYGRLKNLTMYGYFTAKIVLDQVTKPIIFHPSFEGCSPYTPGVLR